MQSEEPTAEYGLVVLQELNLMHSQDKDPVALLRALDVESILLFVKKLANDGGISIDLDIELDAESEEGD